mgnify:FL=1|jgi:DNA-binding YbaB/EbfC family protein
MAKSSGRNRYLRRGSTRGTGSSRSPTGNTSQMAEAQALLQKAQEQLATEIVEGTSGGGAVRIVMNGEQKITDVHIDPEVVDPEDASMLEDLILAAIRDASDRAAQIQAQSLGSITAGLNIPGLSD